MHFFLTEETFEAYAPYLEDTWLKDVFAETKILNGIGDQENGTRCSIIRRAFRSSKNASTSRSLRPTKNFSTLTRP